MQAISGIFNFFSSAADKTPQIVGLGALFYLFATTFAEVSTTGVPFLSTLMANTQQGVAAVMAAGSELIP